MSTDNAQDLAVQRDALVNPATGELLEVDRPAPDLLDAVAAVTELEERLGDYRRAIELELIRRIDEATGGTARKAVVDGCNLETNAPTEDVYTVEALRLELGRLIEHGNKAAEAALRELIVHPPRPAAPPPRVDKRRLNALKSSDDRALLAALAAARVRQPNRRTLKVLGRPVNATAEEVE